MRTKDERVRVGYLAQWFDVKQLIKKATGVNMKKIYVKRVIDKEWNGWIVDFEIAPDFEELRKHIWGVVRFSDKSIFIGVSK